ncbi:MAG: murein biosynthesis integral membrane protein MurJ [Rickettsiales bacterium]|nr:murein biosynthesis integral membrane protein MurJ [Rickettsiales bacterium]
MALIRAVSTIGGFTLLSRVFGFLRDILVARYLGAGVLADAFLVAFKIPNFLRRLFAEGAFNAAFVPLFAGTLEEQGKDAAKQVAEQVFSVLAWMVLLVVALAEIFMPWVVLAFAPGFQDDPQKFLLTVLLARMCFPYILMIALVTLLSGVLNSFNRFAAVAATPVLLNICLILAMVFLTPYMHTSAHALAIGVMAAGIAQFVWLVLACKKEGINLTIKWPKLTAPVKKLLLLAAPVALGAGVAQINLLIDIILASLFPGAVSWLYYADRLNELPIGVIGVAVGTALLPMLTKTIKAGDTLEAIDKLNRALVLALVFTLPAAVALALIPQPLISTIYEYGAFAASDTAAVVPALVAYAVGLPAFILVKVFAPGFFAREDTKTPVKIAIFCVAVNIIGNLILMQYYEHVGLAMATTLSAWLNAGLMGFVLLKRKHFVPDASLLWAVFKMLVAAGVMGVALYWLMPQLDFATFWSKVISLSTLVIGGLVVYAVLALALLYRSRYFPNYGRRKN